MKLERKFILENMETIIKMTDEIKKDAMFVSDNADIAVIKSRLKWIKDNGFGIINIIKSIEQSFECEE